ncbi:PKD domain-containing protein [Hymenobacter ruber]
MRFSLPAYRLGLNVLLGLTAWASLGQPASAQVQPRPTAEVLRAQHKTVATPIIKAPAKASPRLDAELQRLLVQASGTGQTEALTASQLRASHPHLRFGQQAGQPTVLVHITAKDVAALLPSLQSRGFEVTASYPKLHFVEGMLPVSQLANADALVSNGLLGITASFEPETDGGLVTSQADYVLEAARARATRPRQITGAGVTIGVLSDSFNYLGGAATDVASGDLPAAGVRVLVESGNTDEGRGMCQLIYDLAPGAAQVFSTANGGEGTFAQHIRDLASTAGGACKVIVDDVRYFTEPYFQDGVIAQAVTDVVSNSNVTYFASAGNYADKSYETTAPQFVANANGVRCLNFDVSGATTDLTQRITIPSGGTFYPVLQWSDPFYTTSGVRTDLDMFILGVRSTGAVDTVFRSNARNVLTQVPMEPIFFTNSAATGTTTFDLVIVWKGGIQPARLKYVNRGSASPSEWLTGSHTSYGHSSAAEAFAVAAVPYYNQRVPESFTSKAGPITYLFSPTGVALSTAMVRQKPNIAAVDGTNTTFFGSDYENDGFPNFFGTSAAAPHAAAVAVLLRSAEPALTPTQVYSRLVGSARLLGTTATDALTGPGLIDAFTALYGPVVAATPPVAEDLEKGALPVSWNVNGYGAARPQVLTLAPASGVQSLVMDAQPGITSVFSLNEATLFLQGATASNLQLTFRERKFSAETDELMPAQFTGRSNTDGVALSVDGGTSWYRIFDLTGTNATTTFQTKTVDLTAFATANSLTLGNDIRIKFQQYGRGGATATAGAGRAFDDIVVGSRTPAPTPLYTYSQPTTGCPGLQVQYTDSSLFRPTSWAWTFAGGTPATSTLRNPNVTYNTPGRHSVTLSVSNAAGTVARTDTGVVVITGRAPVATITNTSLVICPGEIVTFGSTALYCPTTYAWTIPGGSPSTSTTATPRGVSFATAGNYTVTLTVSNAYGSSTSSVVVEVGGKAPTPTITSTNPSICHGGAVTFGSTTLNCPSTYAWSFPGGSPASSTSANPGAVTYATAGNYTATLIVTNPYGSTTTTLIVDVDGQAATPFTENFNAAATLPRGWTLVTPTPAYPWAVVSNIIGSTGTATRALVVPFASDPNRGERIAVYSPALNLTRTGAAAPTLRFDVAYRAFSSTAGGTVTDNDSLSVQVADACTGLVLGRPYAKSALTNLPTGTSLPTFTPTAASEWRRETVDLTAYSGHSVVLRFIGRNQYGNNLYLDNVQVNDGVLSMTSAANAVGFEAWPNPTPSGTALNLRLPAFTGRVSLRLIDALGRVVWQESVQQTGAPLERILRTGLAPGLYDLLYTPAGGTPAARHLVLE